MKKSEKIVFGGVIGILFASLVTSTYFYTFYRKFKKRLRETLKVWDF